MLIAGSNNTYTAQVAQLGNTLRTAAVAATNQPAADIVNGLVAFQLAQLA